MLLSSLLVWFCLVWFMLSTWFHMSCWQDPDTVIKWSYIMYVDNSPLAVLLSLGISDVQGVRMEVASYSYEKRLR